MSRTATPLAVLRVDQPCPADWNAMPGDERRRFCSGCGLHVHNLSAMPRDEAERLVCETAGRLCVRYERTLTGRVRTLEYATPEKAAVLPYFRKLVASLIACGLVFATAAGLLSMFARPTMGVIRRPPRNPRPIGISATQPLGPADPRQSSANASCELDVDAEEQVTASAESLGPPAPGN